MAANTTNYSDTMLGVQYEAKLKYLFIMTIKGIPTYLCTKASRPKWNAAQVQYNYLNSRRYTAGKVTWDTINVTVVDAFTPSGAQAVMAWLRAKHEPTTGRDGYASNYMQNCKIEVLGPGGDVQQSWTLYNCWVTSAQFGDLDMTDQNTPMQINLTLRYDKAVLQF